MGIKRIAKDCFGFAIFYFGIFQWGLNQGYLMGHLAGGHGAYGYPPWYVHLIALSVLSSIFIDMYRSWGL